MATATSSDNLAVADWDHASESKSDRYLAARLAAAGADCKSVAVATFMLAAALVALAWLLLGVVAEHWLVPGGLPAAARWAWFLTGVTAFGAAIVRWLVPLVRYRVNLVYAAREIEHDHPELHNDLVNAVLVKAHPEASSSLVVRALERRAAKRLSDVPTDGVADRGVPLRLTVALAAVAAALVVYQVVAPKSLVVSAARLVAPWWDGTAPSRVRIDGLRLAWRMPPAGAAGEPTPLPVVDGVATHVRGRQLLVDAGIEGLRAGEQALLRVIPVRDGGAPAVELPLAATADRGRMAAVVRDADLDQTVELVVSAGDARSERVRIEVVDAPTLLVREVRYDYPPYTNRQPEIVAWEGDLKAPEFTKVTIVAESNGPLAAAWVDPDCTGRPSEKKEMRVQPLDLSRATVEFPLLFNADRTAQQFSSYRLGFQPRSSAGSREPPVVDRQVEHTVEMIPDVAPEVAIEAPEDGLRVPPSAPVAIRAWAKDPDYGVARVGIEARIKDGRSLETAWLLEQTREEAFTGTVELVPERVGAAAGAVIEYRAVAIDTRPVKPNVTHSAWRALRIDATAPPPPPPRAQRPPAGGEAGANQAGKPSGGAADPSREPREAGERSDDPGRRDQGGDGAQEPQPGGGAGAADRQQGDGSGKEGGDPQQAPGGGAPREDGKTDDGKGGAGSARDGEGRQGDRAGKEGTPRGDGESADDGRKEGGAASGRRGQRDGERGQEGPRQDGGGEAGGRQTDRGREAAPRNDVASDGTNDGEAMERILQQRQRDAATAGREREAADADGAGQSGKPPQSGPQQERGGRPQEDEPGAKSDGESEPPPGERGPKPRDSDCPSCAKADGKPCGKEGCSSCSGGAKSGGSSGGGSGQGQPGQGQPGQGQPGQGQPGQGQPGQGQPGQGQPGQGQPGQGQPGQGQPGQGQPGQGQPGEGQPGEVQPGEGERGQQAPGDRADGSPIGQGVQLGAGGQRGGDRGGSPPSGADATKRDVEWTEQEMAHVRHAADLAIEHLRDSVNAGRTDVLEELGWTPEQARAFIDRWDSMRRLEDSQDDHERGEFARALRSLGLRPAGTSASRDVAADAKGGQAEGRRSRPPPAYREQFEAFQRGTGSE